MSKRAAPLPSDPPAGAKLYDVDGLAVAVVGEDAAAYDPDARPWDGSMMLAFPVSREDWDAVRAASRG